MRSRLVESKIENWCRNDARFETVGVLRVRFGTVSLLLIEVE